MDSSLDITPPTGDSPQTADTSLKPLTRKQTALVELLTNHPELSQTEAYMQVYKPNSREAARVEASRTLAKPNVLAVLQAHATKAEETLTEVMEYAKEYGKQGNTAGANYAATSASIANSILDRIHGKAKQSIDVTNTSVNLNIDLS